MIKLALLLLSVLHLAVLGKWVWDMLFPGPVPGEMGKRELARWHQRFPPRRVDVSKWGRVRQEQRKLWE